MRYYKVWTQVEMFDDEETAECYEDVGDPVSIGEFDTLEEAQEFQEQLFLNRTEVVE